MADLPEQGPLSTAVTNQDSETPQASLQSTIGQPVKITGGGKGTLATITPTAGTILDEQSSKGILDNMQKMLDEYNSPYKKFQDSLKEAHAWTKYDKTPAFQQLQIEQEQDRANKYNIAQSMAAMQAMQNQNKVIADTMAGTGTTAGGTAGGAPGAYTGPFANEVNSLPESQRRWGAVLARTNPTELMKTVQQNELKKPDQLKVLDTLKGMDYTPQNEAWARQNFPNLFQPAKRVINGVATEYSPDAASLFKQPNAPTPTQGKTTAADWAVDNGFQVISGTRTPVESAALVHHYDENGTPRTAQGRPVDLKTSSHFTGDGFDVKPGSVTPELDAKAAAAGYKRGTGLEENHFSRVGSVPGMKAEIKATAPTGAISPARPLTPGEQDTSIPGVEQQYKNIALTNEAVGKVYKDLTDNKTMYQDAADSAKMAIKAVEEGKGEEQGPGSTIKQNYIFAKIAAGVPVDPEELARYSRNLTIEQAKQQYVAHGAKAAMGAQYTGKEADNFAKSLTSINDPAEFVKTTFQIMQAKNEVNLAHLRFLDKYPKDLAGGERAWDASGERERIFKDTVTAFNKTPAATKAPNIQGDATKHFGSYDPNKYNYGYENGKFYREEK